LYRFVIPARAKFTAGPKGTYEIRAKKFKQATRYRKALASHSYGEVKRSGAVIATNSVKKQMFREVALVAKAWREGGGRMSVTVLIDDDNDDGNDDAGGDGADDGAGSDCSVAVGEGDARGSRGSVDAPAPTALALAAATLAVRYDLPWDFAQWPEFAAMIETYRALGPNDPWSALARRSAVDEDVHTV
jgi:hypothetical protein